MTVATYAALALDTCTHATWQDFGFADPRERGACSATHATQSAPYIKDWHLQASALGSPVRCTRELLPQRPASMSLLC